MSGSELQGSGWLNIAGDKSLTLRVLLAAYHMLYAKSLTSHHHAYVFVVHHSALPVQPLLPLPPSEHQIPGFLGGAHSVLGPVDQLLRTWQWCSRHLSCIHLTRLALSRAQAQTHMQHVVVVRSCA